MIRRIPLSTASNMRDLGGYPVDIRRVDQTERFTLSEQFLTNRQFLTNERLLTSEQLLSSGQFPSNRLFTQYGRLFRSDCPSAFTVEDMAWIQRLNIRTVIDMRSSEECEEVPSAYASVPGIAYQRCPFTIGANYPSKQADIPNTYLAMFADEENMARILSHIAAAEGAVVFHCVAGKDRTGVVTAVLLTMAGVALDDVLADYQVSHTYLREFLRKRREQYPEMPDWAGRSESWYLEDSLGELLRRHNGMEGYLDRLGISAVQRQALVARLLH